MPTMPLSRPLAEQSSAQPPARSAAQPADGPDVTVDVRDRPLEALHRAYEDRWHLIAGAGPDHPVDEELTRNAQEVNELERQCRPHSRALPRRTGPDPSTFLG